MSQPMTMQEEEKYFFDEASASPERPAEEAEARASGQASFDYLATTLIAEQNIEMPDIEVEQLTPDLLA